MIYMFLAEGFEEIEALCPLDLLRRAGLEARTVGVGGKVVRGAHGIEVIADMTTSEAAKFVKGAPCEMVVLPGGMPGTKHLGEHQGLCRLLREFANDRKYIAAICAAPMVLGSLGLLKGRYATIYPGMESHLAGAACEKHVVVWDGNLITSQGPGTAMIFALAIVDALCGQEMGDRIAEELILPHEEEE